MMAETTQKTGKNKWISYTLGPELIPLQPFDVQPVADIPIRLAVESGALKMKKGLALYKTTDEWNGHPKGSIVIAGLLEAGQPIAVWVGNIKKIPSDENPPDETGEPLL